MESLAGKVAVVTGGASGIGRALGERFAAEGMQVVLADVECDALDRAVAELASAGAEVVGVPTDVAQLAQVEALRDRTFEVFGAVHLVCNNAGVAGGSAIDSPIEVWRWVLGVNLWGVVHGCHVFLPHLLAQDDGHVVNTASVAGLGGIGALGVYCTSKSAVVGLTESLYDDLAARGSTVSVSVVCPGFVRTRISESHRNMPDEVRAVTPADAVVERAGHAIVGLGIEPSAVADGVVEAVRARRLYVLPHARGARWYAERRLAWMASEEPAPLDPQNLVRP